MSVKSAFTLVTENVSEPLPLQVDNAEEAGHHYLRRWQIWAPIRPSDLNQATQRYGTPGREPTCGQYAWKPYDQSAIQVTAPPREDVKNFFYLNIRYRTEDAKPDLVFSHFSATLVDFLRLVIGGEFFKPNPESPLTDLVLKFDDIKAHCLDARAGLDTLSGRELRTKAKDLGRLDSLATHKTELDARQYLEDLIEKLDVLIPLIEKEFKPIADRLELELSYGHISYDLLSYYFKKGEKIHYDSHGTKDKEFGFFLHGRGMVWDGYNYVREPRKIVINNYPGTMPLSDLECKIMSDDVHNELTERGRLYAAVSGGVHFKSYNGRRVVIDGKGPAEQARMKDRSEPPPARTCTTRRLDDQVPPPGIKSSFSGNDSYVKPTPIAEDDLDLLPAIVNGFDIRRKTWETFDVRKLEEIHFDEDAWDHLVLDKATKTLIKGLVNVTKMSNKSNEVLSDVITGKSGGLIALLHGPPGTGKTLTAEAVAEHLKRPLYVLNSLELSTTPAVLEKNLEDTLKLAMTWDAVVLIDEADVFLEQRSLHELERNALVSVVLRVLEYHHGVLFLTTNRIQAFDEAFLSRFSIAVKYPELDMDARLTIWQNFFALAGCELWGGSGRQTPDGYVRLEGREPQCYVSLSDLQELAKKPFNGRTIKNVVRTAQALAMSTGEPLSSDHVKVVVEAQEKLLTEFANVKL